MPEPIIIDSLDDPRVDSFRDVRDADLRGREKLFMAESELVIRRLLRTPDRIHSLLLSPNKFLRMREALQGLPGGTPVYVAEMPLMTEIAGFRIHRGALAAGIRPRPQDLSLDAALGHLVGRQRLTLLLVENVTNVDNMGGLFRNAAAFGADGVIIGPTSCDPLYRKAIRVSMGHALTVPYAMSTDWPGDLARLKREWGISLVGAEVTADAKPLWEWQDRPRAGFVFGSEGSGIAPATLAQCDAVYQIPMTATVPSLNVAVASAVFLYEQMRGRAGV